MDIRKYLIIIWRRKWVILVTALITTFVVFLGTQLYSPVYEATSTLRIAASRTGRVTYEDLLYADRLLKTYAEIASGSSVKEKLVQRLGLRESPDVTAVVLPNTELLRITVENSDPNIARAAANILAEIIILESEKLGERSNTISIVDPAVTPLSPVLSMKIIIALGVIFGIIGGLGLTFVFENLDKTLYASDQIEKASDLSTLVRIPKIRNSQSNLIKNNSPKYYTQAFHILRTNIFMQNHRKSLKTILITSPEPGEGKSTIVTNLAFSIAQIGKKVVLVDGDMRKPKLHVICQVPNQVGLSNFLVEDLKIEKILQQERNGFFLITSGPIPADPTSLLMSEKISDLIKALENQFDYVLFDTPALLAVPDAKLLAKHVDGFILVVSRAKISEDTILEVNKYMKDIETDPIGIVINKAELKHRYYYYQSP